MSRRWCHRPAFEIPKPDWEAEEAERREREREAKRFEAARTLGLERTMIAETPSSLCTKGATAKRRKQMAAARGELRGSAPRPVSAGLPSSTTSTARPVSPRRDQDLV